MSQTLRDVIAQHALADAGDVDRAVMAARRALSGALTDMRPIERVAWFRR